MPAAILALSLVLISLPVAFAAASLGGVVLLAFSMAVLCVASPLFYLKYQFVDLLSSRILSLIAGLKHLILKENFVIYAEND